MFRKSLVRRSRKAMPSRGRGSRKVMPSNGSRNVMTTNRTPYTTNESRIKESMLELEREMINRFKQPQHKTNRNSAIMQISTNYWKFVRNQREVIQNLERIIRLWTAFAISLITYMYIGAKVSRNRRTMIRQNMELPLDITLSSLVNFLKRELRTKNMELHTMDEFNVDDIAVELKNAFQNLKTRRNSQNSNTRRYHQYYYPPASTPATKRGNSPYQPSRDSQYSNTRRYPQYY